MKLSGRTHIERAAQKLSTPVDASSLIVFRILFGVIVCYEAFSFFRDKETGELTLDVIRGLFIDPPLTFTFLSFITPWPGSGMYIHFGVMILAALGLTLGLFYRFSTALFCLTFAYFFLLEKSMYLNHYYLTVLIAFLLVFLNAHVGFSVDARLRPKIRSRYVPFWNIFILRAQIVVVYFFAGVAKISEDWLRGEPFRDVLQTRSAGTALNELLTREEVVYFFCYGGMLFDLLIGFLLVWRRTRVAAMLVTACFHLTNDWVFNIGMFPWMMLSSTVLFFEPDWPRRLIDRLRNKSTTAEPPPAPTAAESAGFASSRRVLAFVTVYLLIQSLLPLRHWLYPGNHHWTGEGRRFAWMMKLRHTYGLVRRISFTNPETGKTNLVDMRYHLNNWRINKMARDPDMILQYVHFLKDELKAAGVLHPVIRVDIVSSMNGRPFQYLIRPEVDLANVEWSPFSSANWIVPLREDVPIGNYREIREKDPRTLSVPKPNPPRE